MSVIKYKTNEIEYNLSRRAKKYINISIRNNEVYVTAPKRVPIYEIENVISEKSDWIKENLNNQEYKKNEFEDGKRIWFKGLQYEVRVVNASKNKIEIFGNTIIINTKDISKEYAKIVFQKWLYAEAEGCFKNEVLKWHNIMSEFNIPIPDIQIRKMRSRWGSCIPSKKKICLNISLMNVPTACMEYVILHELTHFIELNHNSNFYSIVQKYMPDWKTRKNKLNKEYGNIL